MKTSIYNSVISLLDRHTLIYNALSGDFVIIKDRMTGVTDSDVSSIFEKDKTLFSQLTAAGMVVEDGLDEIGILERRISETDGRQDAFMLHVNPTLDCNFRCWYCYERHIEGSVMSKQTLDSLILFVEHILEEKTALKRFDLAFFGGEPLLEFDGVVKPLIMSVSEKCGSKGVAFTVQFTSNGYLLDDERISFLSRYPCAFQITLDGGRKFHDRTRFTKKGRGGTYDAILANVIRLARENMDVILRINYTGATLTSVDSVLSDMKGIPERCRRHIRIDLQRVWQDIGTEKDGYDSMAKEIRGRFRTEGFTVLTNFLSHDVRDSCYGDKINHVLINYNGDAFGCTARDFTARNRIGRLSDDGHVLYDGDIYERRNRAKLSKEICRLCRIAPVCGGGCRQKALESMDNEGCTLGYSEKDKDDIVLDIFEYSYLCNK